MERMIVKDNKLVFIEDTHSYYYDGNKLPGITCTIGKRLGKNFPGMSSAPSRVAQAAEFGSAIHSDVEKYFLTGKAPKHPISEFVCQYVDDKFPEEAFERYGELLVSDKEKVATAIDIVVVNRETKLAGVLDIKTGNFDREYCSWQLGIGGYLLQSLYGIEAVLFGVIATKDRRGYTITPKSVARIESLLYGK